MKLERGGTFCQASRQQDTGQRVGAGAFGYSVLKWLSLLLPVVLLGVACRNGGPHGEEKRTLTVFAAASLRDVFLELAESYRRVQPTVELAFNFAGTQELRTQVEHGATVDVFAGADTKHIAELVRQGLAGPSVVFAENEPVLVVGAEAQSRLRSFADLATVDRVVLGTADVPIGRYALQILDKANDVLAPNFRARVESHVVSRELNVRQVLSKVALGEAEAGIVYRTDVRGSADKAMAVVEIPPQINVIASYPIAVTAKGDREADARRWVEFVTSETGREILSSRGFRLPPLAKTQL